MSASVRYQISTPRRAIEGDGGHTVNLKAKTLHLQSPRRALCLTEDSGGESRGVVERCSTRAPGEGEGKVATQLTEGLEVFDGHKLGLLR